LSAKLLDTDTLIELVRGSLTVTNRYLSAISEETELHLSTISLFEFKFGMERSDRHAQQQPAFERLLTTIRVAPFGSDDADEAARLKSQLTSTGQMIRAYDLLIAGQALARDWTLVTSNRREFGRVERLVVEDWRAPA
jgi:tRNA(fMet)-specific endonuclease VapC